MDFFFLVDFCWKFPQSDSIRRRVILNLLVLLNANGGELSC